MKHHARTALSGLALLVAVAVVACGGKQTMASKSAAAYDEAKKKGIAIESGEHGGHSVEAPTEHAVTTHADHSTMAGMDHGAMPGMKHSAMSGGAHGQMSGMDHTKMSAMDHAKMSAMDHAKMSAMDHAKMPGMTHGTHHEMTAMDHSAMPGMDHSAMAGMSHGSMAEGHKHGSQMAAPMVIAPPTSNAAIAHTQPAATLRPDDFDAPAPAAVDEARKTAQPPPEHHHGNGEAS